MTVAVNMARNDKSITAKADCEGGKQAQGIKTVRSGPWQVTRSSNALLISSTAQLVPVEQMKGRKDSKVYDKICMATTRLACNRAIESSYWRMDNNSDVGLLMGYVLYRLPIELEFMDLDTFSR
jgi:hypothetical protein